jgi:hypothetical protein
MVTVVADNFLNGSATPATEGSRGRLVGMMIKIAKYDIELWD